ncbi:hypothetical protein BDN67DRAFT_654047 [Paxillus ammoniavirescens]|nr:hypothetical protein BDN67DRAFT_654047 [Paxillus ammoniavirescens]
MFRVGAVLLIPLACTVVCARQCISRLLSFEGVRYGIASDALIGACFFQNGLGNLTGVPIAGYLSDMVVTS